MPAARALGGAYEFEFVLVSSTIVQALHVVVAGLVGRSVGLVAIRIL
jgi:hypothetical protein